MAMPVPSFDAFLLARRSGAVRERGVGRVAMGWCGLASLISAAAWAGPVTTSWAVGGPDDSAAVAASALSGWYAVADSYKDTIEICDVNQTLVRTISKTEIQGLLPWMNLDGSPDGPDAACARRLYAVGLLVRAA